MIKTVGGIVLNLLLLIVILYFSLYSAWYASYSNYFFFPVVYEIEDIHGNVLEYAPKNRKGKKDFAYVASGLHLKLFAEMLKSVEKGGEGLADITYPSGNSEKKLFLTHAEVVHLQDVADLLSFFKSFFRLFLVILTAVAAAMIFGGIWPFYTRNMLYTLGGFALLMFVLISRFGFVKVFYRLHVMVFPKGHQWFFYYEDSLMSTILKAPDSFADFGVILAVFAVIFFVILYWLVSMLIRSLIRHD